MNSAAHSNETESTMSRTMNENAFASIQNIRFGIEIEAVGLNGETAAHRVTRYLNANTDGGFSCYGNRVRMADGREFSFVYDGSISGVGCEMVSPILTHADMETLQHVVRGMFRAGLRAHPSCGIHVHVDGAYFDAPALRNLIKMVAKHEDLIYHAVGGMRANCTTGDRSAANWCRPVSETLLAAAMKKDATIDSIVDAFYNDGRTGGASARRGIRHYHGARYRGLNLHNFAYRPNSPTVEFRYFEPTLHAGRVKSYIQMCLALAVRAKSVTKCSAKKVVLDTSKGKYQVRKWLRDLRLTGAEFKTARTMLALRFLDGDAVLNRRAA